MAVWLHALLGTPPDELWFLSDFLFAHHLLSEEADRQVWSTQIDVFTALNTLREEWATSNHMALHGSPRSELFSLPTTEQFHEKFEKGSAMKRDFLRSVRRMAKDAKAGQHIVLLLFGHGDARLPTLGQVQCRGCRGFDQRSREPCGFDGVLCPGVEEPVMESLRSCDDGLSGESPYVGSDRTWGSRTFWAAILELAANAHASTSHPALIHPQLETFEPALDESSLQTPSASTGSGVRGEWDSGESEDEDSEDDVERKEEEEEMEVDEEDLEKQIKFWERPSHRRPQVRNPLSSAIKRYRAGAASTREISRLARSFQQRAAADECAQRVAEEVGVAGLVPCSQFEEAARVGSYEGIPFIVVDWGSVVSPRDIVGNLQQTYKRAGQYLFCCWRQSGKGRDVLEDILQRTRGKIYYERVEEFDVKY